MKFIFLILVLSITIILNGQNKQSVDKGFSSDDSIALVKIANYPDSLRTKILLACGQPDLLKKTELLQKNSSQLFRNLVDNYSKEQQQNFWDLSRYPALISEIGGGEKKTKEELKTIATKFPEEMRSKIIKYGQKHYEVLSEINKIYKNTNEEYEKITLNHQNNVKESYQTLINHPDILNVLVTNMNLSVTLGNMYTADPKYTILMLDSIKINHEIQNEKEKEDWKNGLEKNSEAKKEMELAAKEFINSEPKSDIDIDDIYADNSSSNPTPKTDTNPASLNIDVQPYPYWFGYPWWHDYPYWYPYPYWYYTGFYWGPSGVVFMSLPSAYFMNWYFFNPYHHYSYSHFSDYSLEHHSTYYGKRNQRTGFNSEVHRWMKANEPNLPKDFFNSDNNRKQRIRELGRFELDYQNNTRGVFGRNISRSEFLQNNPNYYPHLSPAIKQPRFNNRISYPKQQNPVRYNMEQPGKPPTPITRPQNTTPRQPTQRTGGGNGSKRNR